MSSYSGGQRDNTLNKAISNMDCREFVTRAAAASAAVTLPGASGKPKVKQPNVLYVFSDQHRAASLPGEAFNEAIAPSLAKFRSENLSMTAVFRITRFARRTVES